jgi:deoxyribodipyrimidine photolyase-related protein
VYLIEEPLLLTEFGTHRQKLLLHRLSLMAYKDELEAAGYDVVYLDVREHQQTDNVFQRLKKDGVHTIHVVDTVDDWLERRLRQATATYHFVRQTYESPLFIFSDREARERFLKSKRSMKRFYEAYRKESGILMNTDGTPKGGVFSFDSENRKKLPKGISLPADITRYKNKDIDEAHVWLQEIKSEQYGTPSVWLPYARAGAEAYLEDFLATRLTHFGDYEDALTTNHTRVFHSTLSPLINIGLLNPLTVVEAALAYALTHNVPQNSLEGFIRQIIGWREFMRASYLVDGNAMRTQNFFNHTRPLSDSFWNATTGIFPIDQVITTALSYGYTHHIERLMVIGNFMLLSRIHPDEVYRWFMAMYVDAYDWVMVPNVYGMSQFSDGGSFATKPYISGSSYLEKMSNYPQGNWNELWTALYWQFIADHSDFFASNHRLSMMPKLLDRMSKEKRSSYEKIAQTYLNQ